MLYEVITNEAASAAMTELMIQRGHKRIVYLAARMDVRTRLKMSGYARAMQARGLEARDISTDESSNFSLGAKLLSYNFV